LGLDGHQFSRNASISGETLSNHYHHYRPPLLVTYLQVSHADSRTFEQIAYLAGLPPIRLHDPRHFAATLALAAGVDIKVVQEKLGHSSRAITSDTYTTVLPEVARAAAEATAALLPMYTTGTREPAPSPQPMTGQARSRQCSGTPLASSHGICVTLNMW
jgi:Phage integrase family